MPKRSPQSRARARAQDRRRTTERRRRFVIVTAGVLAAAFIVSLGALSIKDQTDEPTPSETPTAEPTDVNPSPIQGEAACETEPASNVTSGTSLVAFDDASDARVVKGDADLAIDDTERRQGDGSLRIDMGKRTEPATVRAMFREPVNIQEGVVGLWMRQNGSIFAGGLEWTVRLSSDATNRSDVINAFEYVLHPVDVAAATRWCYFAFDLRELGISGRPDPSQIRLIEVTVPGFKGTEPGNTVWLDGVSFREPE